MSVSSSCPERLSEADLEVACTEEIHQDRNVTLHLNCSVGEWGDGVVFSWTSPAWTGKRFRSVISIAISQDDQNVTCTAENRIGNASRTVSLKQACTGELSLSKISRLCARIFIFKLVFVDKLQRGQETED